MNGMCKNRNKGTINDVDDEDEQHGRSAVLSWTDDVQYK